MTEEHTEVRSFDIYELQEILELDHQLLSTWEMTGGGVGTLRVAVPGRDDIWVDVGPGSHLSGILWGTDLSIGVNGPEWEEWMEHEQIYVPDYVDHRGLAAMIAGRVSVFTPPPSNTSHMIEVTREVKTLIEIQLDGRNVPEALRKAGEIVHGDELEDDAWTVVSEKFEMVGYLREDDDDRDQLD